jgi:ribosomal protein L11 methylase PrmA
VKPGGRLIVSGISAPRSAEVAAALRGVGFVGLQETLRDGERRGDMTERWAAYTGERPAAAQ